MKNFMFIPNDFARRTFNLQAPKYIGEQITSMMAGALGEENRRKYVPAQEPLYGGKTLGEIFIICNRGEIDSAPPRFESIGTIYDLR